MDWKRIVYEFVGGVVSLSTFFILILVFDELLEIYPFVNGEVLLIILILFGFPAVCFLTYYAIDKIFFKITHIGKLELVIPLVINWFFGGIGCAFILNSFQGSNITKGALLILISVATSLFSYNLIYLNSVTRPK